MLSNTVIKPKLTSLRIIAILMVIANYTFILSHHFSFSDFSRVANQRYSLLTAGFLSGHLHLPAEPSAELLNLKNPYDPVERGYLSNKSLPDLFYDTTLYKKKYFLYFGPLPALSFFMPIKLLTGFYPPESLAIFTFLTLGMLVTYYLLFLIKDKYFPLISETQEYFAIFLLGFSGNATVLLARPSSYEVAIASAFFMMSLALLFLYRVFENHFRFRDTFLFGLCLALTVAGRPHFVFVAIFLLVVVSIFVVRYVEAIRLRKILSAVFFPMVTIGIALALYNYLRFDSIFEFGAHYQLDYNNNLTSGIYKRTNLHNFLLCLYSYTFNIFESRHHFPYIAFTPAFNNPNFVIEPTAGIFRIAPVIMLCALLPSLFIWLKQKKISISYGLFTNYIGMLACVPIIIFIFLLTLNGAVQRYESDFLPYLVMLSILSLWFFEKSPAAHYWKRTARSFYYLAGFRGILIGYALAYVSVVG